MPLAAITSGKANAAEEEEEGEGEGGGKEGGFISERYLRRKNSPVVHR